MLYFFYNNYPYILASYGYYKIIINSYETYETGKSIYETLKWLVLSKNRKMIEDDKKIIILKELDDSFILINDY